MRRCTVWSHQAWADKRVINVQVKYMGWLIQLDPKDGYNGKCTVVDERGKMLREDMDCVQVHTPERIPLLHGAPRRADSDAARPADEQGLTHQERNQLRS